jgi:hypothetical protein
VTPKRQARLDYSWYPLEQIHGADLTTDLVTGEEKLNVNFARHTLAIPDLLTIDSEVVAEMRDQYSGEDGGPIFVIGAMDDEETTLRRLVAAINRAAEAVAERNRRAHD